MHCSWEGVNEKGHIVLADIWHLLFTHLQIPTMRMGYPTHVLLHHLRMDEVPHIRWSGESGERTHILIKVCILLDLKLQKLWVKSQRGRMPHLKRLLEHFLLRLQFKLHRCKVSPKRMLKVCFIIVIV